MIGKTLKHAPLIEAIFEVKWQTQELKPNLGVDPHYNLLIGRLYERLKDEYPFHEPLPTAMFPNEMVSGLIQHRLRKDEKQWPVVQLGPGVFTVNDTGNYHWQDFKDRSIQGINTLFDIYPDAKSLINNLVLRYINGVEFNFEAENIFNFLREQMKLEISLPSPLFENPNIEETPLNFSYIFTLKCIKPKATITLRFARGKKQLADALIWETTLRTHRDNIPLLPLELDNWLEDAHTIIEDWFFKLIEGDLEKRFV